MREAPGFEPGSSLMILGSLVAHCVTMPEINSSKVGVMRKGVPVLVDNIIKWS